VATIQRDRWGKICNFRKKYFKRKSREEKLKLPKPELLK
jgi:hypothetical protein